ncbi:hypothetical protein GW17_00044820 [Ensete ventricosum]|nr:hypothetical protein GW17_00044820 [Ensete ventricosum]
MYRLIRVIPSIGAVSTLNRPSTIDFGRYQLREEKEEGEEKPGVALLFPRAICCPRAKNRPRDPSPTSDFFFSYGEKKRKRKKKVKEEEVVVEEEEEEAMGQEVEEEEKRKHTCSQQHTVGDGGRRQQMAAVILHFSCT